MRREQIFYVLKLAIFTKVLLVLPFLLLLIVYPAPNNNRDQQRLIQWGHDTPFLQDIPNYSNQLATLPFDGLILDIESPNDRRGLSWLLFREPIDNELLTTIREEFTDYQWGDLTDNFLRVTIYNPDLTWDNWDIWTANLAEIASLARDLGFVGIMFDTEQYPPNIDIFDYPAQNADTPRSFDAYRNLAYQRGAEVMQAIQERYPDITIMYTLGITHRIPWLNAPPLDEHRYGLLVPFIEGMIDASETSVTLIDGYEASYLYLTEQEFLTSYKWIRGGVSLQLDDGQQYRNTMQAGFGLWLDPYCGDGGLPEDGCGFTQAEFRTALSLALQYSDRYVWLYSEHIDWFENQGIPSSWWDTINTFRQ